jgi:uncharacterized protein YbjQ (UPF0145 family)
LRPPDTRDANDEANPSEMEHDVDRTPAMHLAAATLLLAFQYGCSYTAAFNRQPYVDMEAVKQYAATQKPKTPEQIVFLKDYPKQSHVVLGTLHAPEVEWTAHYDNDDLIKAMRKKAAEIGADAIIDFRYKENPTVHTVGSVSISGTGGYGSFTAVPYKGLHAWGEAIIFIPENRKKLIESK